MDPSNVKCWRSEHIGDYDDMRNLVGSFVQSMNGNQSGDPKKAVSIMLDVVKGEGVAEGKAMPERLPLGADVLSVVRKSRVDHLAVCNEWEDIIRSTGHE
jgi:hypothetical protein